MAAKPVLQPFAICEMCWMDEHAHWEPESMNESGNILMKLSGVDNPEILKTGSVEVCCMCGIITIAGIYEMKAPHTVYFMGDEAFRDFEFNFNDTNNEE